MKLQIIHIGELKTNLIKNIRIDCIFIFTDVYDWYYTDHLIGLRIATCNLVQVVNNTYSAAKLLRPIRPIIVTIYECNRVLHEYVKFIHGFKLKNSLTSCLFAMPCKGYTSLLRINVTQLYDN